MRSIFLPYETTDPKETLFIFFDIDSTLLYGRASPTASECWVTCPETLKTALDTITQLCVGAGMNAQFGILTSKKHVDDLVEEAIGVLQNYIYCTNLDTSEQVQALSSREPRTPFIYMHSGYPCEQPYNADKIPAVRLENPNTYSPIMLAENCLMDRPFETFLAHMAAYINQVSLKDFLETIKDELEEFNRCYYDKDLGPEEKFAQLNGHFDTLCEHMYNCHQPDNRPETAQKLLSRLSLEIDCFLTNKDFLETIKDELEKFNRCYYDKDLGPEEKFPQLTGHFDRLCEHMYNYHQSYNRPEKAEKLLSMLSLVIDCFLTNREELEIFEPNDQQDLPSRIVSVEWVEWVEWVDYRLYSDITNYERLGKVLDFTSTTLLQTFIDAFHAKARAPREKNTLEQAIPQEQVQPLEEPLNDAKANIEKPKEIQYELIQASEEACEEACEEEKKSPSTEAQVKQLSLSEERLIKAKIDFRDARDPLQTAFNAGHKLQLLQHVQAKFNAPASNIFLIDDCLENTTAAEDAGFSVVSAAATAAKLDLLVPNSDLVQQPAWQDVLSASEGVLNKLIEKVQGIIQQQQQQHEEYSSHSSMQPGVSYKKKTI